MKKSHYNFIFIFFIIVLIFVKSSYSEDTNTEKTILSDENRLELKRLNNTLINFSDVSTFCFDSIIHNITIADLCINFIREFNDHMDNLFDNYKNDIIKFKINHTSLTN